MYSLSKDKVDTETNFVVAVGFMTKVDHQTTSKIGKLFDDRPWS